MRTDREVDVRRVCVLLWMAVSTMPVMAQVAADAPPPPTASVFDLRALAFGLGRAVAVSLVMGAVIWLLVRGVRALVREAEARLVVKSPSGRLRSLFRIAGVRPVEFVAPVLKLLRTAGVVLLALVWIEFVLESLPWTAPYVASLRAQGIAPLRFVWNGFIGFLPDALFLIVIAVVTRLVLRLTRWIFHVIESGQIEFDSFPSDWADPTYKIVRVLIIALGIVAAFPYIPGSSSPAFQGLSLFFGLLVSLSSSSAISNIIAGNVLTYTRAFRVKDVVKIGNTVGEILGKSLLVTNVRTVENVAVSIPNAVVLGTEVLNYTKLASSGGLVLATEVTIGYDVPWRKVSALLTDAARQCEDIVSEPAPIVRVKSLDDFYVTYRLGATTLAPERMMETYSKLHKAILDAFARAGVEIMSPHYRASRDGGATTIPNEAVADTAPAIDTPMFPGASPSRAEHGSV